MAGTGPSAVSSRLQVSIGVSPKSRGSLSGGLPHPSMGTKWRTARCQDLSALFGFCRSSSGAGPPAPPSPWLLLQGGESQHLGWSLLSQRDSPPSLVQRLPHPSIGLKIAHGGLFLSGKPQANGKACWEREGAVCLSVHAIQLTSTVQNTTRLPVPLAQTQSAIPLMRA